MAIDYKNLPKGSFEEAARELLRRSKLKNELADPAFKQQDQLVKIKDQFVSATCTRRAGKSYGLGLKLINTARKWDNSISPYVGLTRKSCENIMWPVLKDINARFGVGITFKDSDLEAILPNGSKISLFGADQKNFIDRLRGPKYPIFVVDECFHGDTLVETSSGLEKIKNIRPGDVVNNAVGMGIVTNVSRKKITNAVSLCYGGKTIICSSNHPFLTSNGWVEAGNLKIGDMLASKDICLRVVRSRDISLSFSESRISKILRDEMCREELSIVSEVSRLYSQSKSNEECRVERESFGEIEGFRAQTSRTQREWPWSNKHRANNYATFPNAVPQLCRSSWSPWKWVSVKLQSGFINSREKAWNRGRWFITPANIKKKARQKERCEAGFIRLDDTKDYKPKDHNGNGEVYFYDIGVSGHPSYIVNGVVVHNCQSFRSHIEELVDDVATPATGDYVGGQIVLTGTPGPVPKGFFYEASIGKHGFTPIRWTVYDNPYFPNPTEFVERLFAKKGWTRENPTYRREWLGEWVADTEALVYRFRDPLNTIAFLPTSKKFIYVLGVDLGYSPDPSAFVLCAYSEFSRELFVVESFQQEKLTIEDIANLIKNYQRKYEGLRIVMDLGAQGKMIGNEIRSRYGIPVMAAEKNGKAGFIEIINSDFTAGYIKILPINRDLIDQLMQLIWDSESELRIEDDRFPNHLTDALLYAWRFCYNFNPKKEEERVLRGTNREIEQHWEREARELEAKLRNEQLDDDMLFG